MQERKRFIEDWLRAGAATNVAALCRLYGISRRTGYKWLERFRQGGWVELEDRSHAAHRQPRRIAESVERRLIEARRQHPSWGPKKLRAWLESKEPQTSWPAASTIGEALKRAGLAALRAMSSRPTIIFPEMCKIPSGIRSSASDQSSLEQSRHAS